MTISFPQSSRTTSSQGWRLSLFASVAAWLTLSFALQAQTVIATLPTGSLPDAVAVNPVTNTTYVANKSSGTVTVIDGFLGAIATVKAGTAPVALAINPVTNKIYVANSGSASVTIIDGATATPTTVAVGKSPESVTVNPITNQIYVANEGSGTVTQIDGASGNTSAITVGTNPISVAVNPVSNQIYVANYGSANVSVIDGPSQTVVATVAAGPNPRCVAINAVTNQIYVGNFGSSTVTVIDGPSNVPTPVGVVPWAPNSLVINPVTNKIYVTSQSGNSISVIDGATNTISGIGVGEFPTSIALNIMTNQLYVANESSGTVSVIDGKSATVTATLTVGTDPTAVAVNPITNKVYVANYSSINLSVIDGTTFTEALVPNVGNNLVVNEQTNEYFGTSLGYHYNGFATDSPVVNLANLVTGTNTTVTDPNLPVNAPYLEYGDIALSRATNQIYVANPGAGGTVAPSVLVISGATANLTANVTLPAVPSAIATNDVTNQVYITSSAANSLLVLNGATNTVTTSIPVGTSPGPLAVNESTNKIYVSNSGSNTVSVVDGSINLVNATIATGTSPGAIAVNPNTNQIYVANGGSNSVTVINGSTNTASSVSLAFSPSFLVLNPTSNKIYAANSTNVVEIDGVTNSVTSVAAGSGIVSLSVDPTTNKIYAGSAIVDGATNGAVAPVKAQYLGVDSVIHTGIATGGSEFYQSVSPVFTPQPIPLSVSITPLATNPTLNPTPTFTFTASSLTDTVPTGVYYQVDTMAGTWSAATSGSSTYTATLASLQPGPHILYAYAVDGQQATSVQSGSPLVSPIQSYEFFVTLPPPVPVTVGTSAGQTSFTVDGVQYIVSATFNWVPGSTHVLSTHSQQGGPMGVEYVFSQWSDGTTSTTDTIVVPNTATTYTADFTAVQAQSISFANPGAQFVGSTLSLSASASSGLAVSYTASGTCAIVSYTSVTFSASGTCSITATQSGNASYLAAPPVTQTFPVMVNSVGFNAGISIPVGNYPDAITLNPITNKVYVSNYFTNNVTVINGADNTTATVNAGTAPGPSAVNTVTNKIYVVNYNSQNVTVIDGATNNTTTVGVGRTPSSVAVNPVTNKIYVVNLEDNTVTVIDGVTNHTTTVAVGTNPVFVAVNPVTNQIYVVNQQSNTVTVIDGASNNVTAVPVGGNPSLAVINPVTNTIYVSGNTVTAINGASNAATTIAGAAGGALAVNPVTNLVYGLNYQNGTATVINGATNTVVATVPAGLQPYRIAVNSTTNQIYITNGSAGTLTVIDGATNNPSTVAAGTTADDLAVNPVTSRVYVTNNAGNNPGTVTVVNGAAFRITAVVANSAAALKGVVNPVTNKIYLYNQSGASPSVSIVDGATNQTTSVAVGSGLSTGAGSIDVNPITNKIYVGSNNPNRVTVIDGSTNNTSTISLGHSPTSLAVNPVTNKIYVVNSDTSGAGFVTVIDGATQNTTTIPVGQYPGAIAVNPATNKIYLTGSDIVSVIDGASNSTTTVTVPNATSLAVNPLTNSIYVVAGNGITEIDGATNTITNSFFALNPFLMAVNPVTNQIYVTGGGTNTGNFTVINGVTGATTTISVGTTLLGLTIDATTNQIYATNYNGDGSSDVIVIDGTTNATTTLALSGPGWVGVNPVTHQAYVSGNSGVAVISPAQPQPIPLTTSITPFTNNQTGNAAPSVTFTANSGTVTIPDGVYFQVDTLQNGWTPATGANPTFTGTVAALEPGFHILYAYATDGQDATAAQVSSPITGAIQAYGFLVTPQLTAQTISFPTIPAQTAGASLTLSATASSGLAVSFSSSTPSVCTVSGTTASFSASGTCTISATQAGTSAFAPATVTQSFSVNPTAQTISFPTIPAQTAGASLTLSATASSGLAVSFSSSTTSVCTVSGTTASFSAAGTCTITASQAGSSVYAPASSVTQSFTVSGGGGGATASYLGSDSTTQGSWTGQYGAQGQIIANDVNNPASYATVSLSGDSPYTWAASTTAVRALQTASGASTRIASTYYSIGTETINLNLTDGNTHRISLYLLDWGSTTRAETITITDANSGSVLSTQPYSAFVNGVYAEWNISGHVLITVTKTGGANAVVSGIFFDQAQLPASATYIGSDSTTQGSWTGQYGAQGQIIANDVNNPASYAAVSLSGDTPYTWAASTAVVRALQTASGASTRIASTYYSIGTETINLNLTDGNTHKISLYLLDWGSTTRAETITITDANSGTVLSTQPYAAFANGVYAEWNISGHVLITVTKTGGANAVVSGIFFDQAQLPASATYIGSDTTTEGTWTGQYGAQGQIIANDVNNPASYATVSLSGDTPYTWAASTAVVRALQTASGASTRIASTYYSIGTETINLNLTDGNTHKISLYLLDWGSTTRAETITITDANSGTVLSTQPYAAFANGVYAEWNISGHVLITVSKTGGANAVVSGIFFDQAQLPASATYIGSDTTTEGTWTGKYGSLGQIIANDVNNPASYAAVSLSGDIPYTWAASTTAVRALQTASGASTRIASTYYSATTETINLNLTDGNTHKISLYLLDWGSTTRAETITITDANSGSVLSTQAYAAFANGVYAEWNISGHVLITVTKTGGANAVVSGIFFD